MMVVTLVAMTVEQVSPVDRPLLATGRPATTATPEPACGGPGTGMLLASVVAPRKRMLPVVSTPPAAACAMAASILGADPVSRL